MIKNEVVSIKLFTIDIFNTTWNGNIWKLLEMVVELTREDIIQTYIEKGMVAIHFISGEKGPTARGYGN
jgi:hypothetical protein